MVDVDDADFRRNIRLVRDRMIQQLETSLKKGANYIDQELAGPHNVLIRPIVKGFYDTFARPDIKKGSQGNLDLCIEAAKEAVLDPGKKFEAIIEKFFPQYLKNDQTAKYCNKFHKSYKWFIENTKNTFKAQVKSLVTVLQCDDPEVSSYNDLMIACYQDPEVARQVLSEQIKYMEMGIQRIEADPSILNIAVGRDLILRVLKRGMKDTREELLADVDVIFKART
ncbi:MAG TPA: hypothetical protein VKM55_13205 [Candidatus Lokiarchaeia archaeon]|nr:hypothetical protein [Candidatus Lokiarchaeia archaeon]